MNAKIGAKKKVNLGKIVKVGLEMDDIVSSLRDQLTKATGKTFSPEQIAAKLKELKDEQAARDNIDDEEIEMWRDRKR